MLQHRLPDRLVVFGAPGPGSRPPAWADTTSVPARSPDCRCSISRVRARGSPVTTTSSIDSAAAIPATAPATSRAFASHEFSTRCWKCSVPGVAAGLVDGGAVRARHLGRPCTEPGCGGDLGTLAIESRNWFRLTCNTARTAKKAAGSRPVGRRPAAARPQRAPREGQPRPRSTRERMHGSARRGASLHHLGRRHRSIRWRVHPFAAVNRSYPGDVHATLRRRSDPRGPQVSRPATRGSRLMRAEPEL